MEPNRRPAVQNLIVIPRCKNSRCFLPTNLVLGYLSLTKLPSSSAFSKVINLRYLDAIIFLSRAPRKHPCPGPKKWKTTCHWLASWDRKLQPRRIEDIISYHIISYSGWIWRYFTQKLQIQDSSGYFGRNERSCNVRGFCELAIKGSRSGIPQKLQQQP